MRQLLKLTVATTIACTMVGCQDDSFSSQAQKLSSSKVVFVEDLTAAIAESTPKFRNSSSSIDDPTAIPASELQGGATKSQVTAPSPKQGTFARWLNPQIEVQARSTSQGSRNSTLTVDPLAHANNQKDPLAPIVVTRGWQQQLNEERANVLGFQKQ